MEMMVSRDKRERGMRLREMRDICYNGKQLQVCVFFSLRFLQALFR